MTTEQLEAKGFKQLQGYKTHTLNTFIKQGRYHIFRSLQDGDLQYNHSFKTELTDVLDINELIDLGQI